MSVSNLLVPNDYNLKCNFMSGSYFPTIVAGAAAGTSPTLSITGSEMGGTISITMGTSPGVGVLATITFQFPAPITNFGILVTPNSSNAAGVPVAYIYATATSASTWTLNNLTAFAASTTYVWNWTIGM